MKQKAQKFFLVYTLSVIIQIFIASSFCGAFEIVILDSESDEYHVEASGSEVYITLGSNSPYGAGWMIDDKGRIKKKQYSSNLCLDAIQPFPGGEVRLRECNNQASQKWEVRGNEIRAFSGSDLCLDVPGGNFINGQHLQLYPCNNTDAQRFKLLGFNIHTVADSNNEKYYLAVDPYSDKLELVSYNDFDGWTYDGWFFDDNNRIREANITFKCLDYPWGKLLYTHRCHSGVNQRWRFVNGEIHGLGNSNLCVDVPGANFRSGQQVQLHPCNGTIAQKWIID